MDDLLETATRCPHCRASVRPGAPWCTLCHADLRPAPVPVPEQPVFRTPRPAPAAPEAGAQAGPPAAPEVKPGDPTWPCTTCGASNAITSDACASCGAGFLSGLRESEGPLLEIPGVGDLTRISRGQRMLLALGVVLAVVALVALLGLLFS